ncbi:pyruvate ferredoxin oxidoreductase [Elusimicrobiota bacterium]
MKNKSVVLTGNQAAAWAAYLSKVQVVSAYPITPQTSIIETLADLMGKAEWPNRFVNVESEHSAMAAVIGASFTGVRTFTATSSQGLLLMHELLHWASGARLPIVLAEVNRSTAPGWSIWTDQNDSLSQRDTGWMQVYCESAQEVLDSVICAFKVSETSGIPTMIVLDAFFLSHTAEPVLLPSQKDVGKFLGERNDPLKTDLKNPKACGGLLGPDYYQEIRKDLAMAMDKAVSLWEKTDNDFEKKFSRSYGLVEPYKTQDADIVIVTSGTVAGTSRVAVDEMRQTGLKVGNLKVRLFRPFPIDLIRQHLGHPKKVLVLDRNFSYGNKGIFFQEIQSALYALPKNKQPKIYNYILGLGGRDVTPELIKEAVTRTIKRNEPSPETIWLGEKENTHERKKSRNRILAK